MIRMQDELQTKYGEYQSKAATWPDATTTKEKELQALDQGLQNSGKQSKWIWLVWKRIF